MPLDIDAVRFSPHALKEVRSFGKDGADGFAQIVEFRDYPRLTYCWRSFRGKALKAKGIAELVVWMVDGIECPDFDAAVARMESPAPALATEGAVRG